MQLTLYQLAAVANPFPHFAFVAGISSGKTVTGAHWVIRMLYEYPGKTGLVAANIYDQLSMATLRELFNAFELYGIQYVSDRQPPPEWRAPKKFKQYSNIISVRYYVDRQPVVAYIFTRVLSDPHALRGFTISWAWLDEIAFTTELAHNVVLGRLRESSTFRTMSTTTPNGENWFFERFIRSRSPLYRSMHVRTEQAMQAGIITPDFYNSLLHSYSPALARQELDAQYVNVGEGRAYYTADNANKVYSYRPDPWRPLIVGCDFNFSPAPMVWEVGQLSEDHEKIHWFDELSATECSTVEMARRLGQEYGQHFLQIYGDVSGERGTTANAGQTDYTQIAQTLSDMGVFHSIDTDQANPRIKDRVENVNRLLRNAAGVMTMTYDPDRCPLLDMDFRHVTWTKAGKLAGKDERNTHGSDAAGYALMKLFPPHGRTIAGGGSVRSQHR